MGITNKAEYLLGETMITDNDVAIINSNKGLLKGELMNWIFLVCTSFIVKINRQIKTT